MARYDNLDARTELEQAIAKDLDLALQERGFTVRHNGTSGEPVKSGSPDIEIWTNVLHINVERL